MPNTGQSVPVQRRWLLLVAVVAVVLAAGVYALLQVDSGGPTRTEVVKVRVGCGPGDPEVFPPCHIRALNEVSIACEDPTAEFVEIEFVAVAEPGAEDPRTIGVERHECKGMFVEGGT